MTPRTSADDQDTIPIAPDGAAAPLAPSADDEIEQPDQPRAGRRQTTTTHTPFLNFVKYLKGDQGAIGEVSYLIARHRAETALLATDRTLALLYRIEAIADQ